MNPTNEILKSPATGQTATSPVLCVDLDGTLVKSDTLVDALFSLFRNNPVQALRCSLALAKGKAAFKAEVAQHVTLNPATLPYNKTLLAHLRSEHAAGRKIVLATASHEHQAQSIADHLGLFSEVVATRSGVNLRDHAKRQILEERYGPAGFDYIGNARPDIPVLGRAKKAMLANPALGLQARLKRQKIAVHKVFEDRSARLGTLLKAVRLKQWPKNILIFLPLVLAHVLFNARDFTLTTVAFFAWSFAASATYIINDLLDMEADRSHASKRKRPFASGDLSPQSGIVTVCVLLGLSAMLASHLSFRFTLWLAAYFITTLAYSLVLKRLALIDVITLAGLYTVRMVAGASVTDVEFSAWLGGFSIFFFLSLAIVKRYAELDNLRKEGRIPVNGRGYRVEDIEQLRSFGTASGYAAVVIFTLYINDNPQILHLYGHFQRLWLLAPVLIFWINRIWLLAHRGELDEDPVVFALTDYWSAILAAIAFFIVYISV